MNDSLTTTEQPVEEEQLTAEEIKFSNLVAKGLTLTTAYRQAFPLKKDLSYNYIRVLASELITKHNIVTEVATSKERAIRLARLAEDRIEETLTEGKQGKATNEVAMFMYDHANGKAMQKTVVEGKHVLVTFDLGGGDGTVPKEILDKLNDE